MLTVAHGQRSNFPNFPPINGLAASASRATSWTMFLLAEALYKEGPMFLLFTSFLYRYRRCFFFLALALSSQPRALHPCMPIKKAVHRVKMVKKGDKTMALKWVPSSFDETDLKKAKNEGFFQQRRWSSSPATSVFESH
jgi:hypothetical protein